MRSAIVILICIFVISSLISEFLILQIVPITIHAKLWASEIYGDSHISFVRIWLSIHSCELSLYILRNKSFPFYPRYLTTSVDSALNHLSPRSQSFFSISAVLTRQLPKPFYYPETMCCYLPGVIKWLLNFTLVSESKVHWGSFNSDPLMSKCSWDYNPWHCKVQ